MAQGALTSHLKRSTKEHGISSARIELEPIGGVSAALLPVGASEVVARPLDNTRPSKRMLVWVDVLADGMPVRAVPVRFDVAVFAKVPVAGAAMAAGTVISGEDLEWREMDVTGLAPFAMSSVKDEKLRLSQPVSAGTPITGKHLTAVFAVNRGEIARLVSQNGLVSLESKVEVLQDGRVGEFVRARPVNATGTVLARVVAPGHLEFQ